MSKASPPSDSELHVDAAESPQISTRALPGYGSVPSARVSGIHEDHHRSDSFADLGLDEEARQRLFQSEDVSSTSRRHCPAPQHSTPRSSARDGERWRGVEPKESGEGSAEGSKHSSPHLKGVRSRAGSAETSATQRSSRSDGRLLIVANRLPLSMSIKRKTDEEDASTSSQITFSNSSGGLVSALSGCDMESRWIGWPGAEVKRQEDRDTVTKKLEELKCVPVFLTQKVCDPFYNGFCNNLLWPLFHYIPLPVEAITTADAEFDAYKLANEAFAAAVLDCYEDGDIVWVHDYHLMLLPHLLRAKKPDMKIGFFFHTPFPAFEIYRMLPGRHELLQGVLAANLIGFHTHDYSRHFQKSCIRILGAKGEHEALVVTNPDGTNFTARLGTFPIGIDPNKFLKTLEQANMASIIAEYKREFKGRKVLLGIDRLDYIKGIQHKLYAFEKLLEKYPELRSEVVFVQIAVPSRTDVVEYQKLKSTTHELVGRVNGIYGGVGHAPIHYLDQSIPFDRMCALYRVADVMVITSIRDGMNLVAFEYIACQAKTENVSGAPGTLILSEFAGAAQSLGDAPLLVNPWSVTECSAALHKALTMPLAERTRRQESMYNYVTTQTAQRWARDYIKGLLTATSTPLSWLKEIHTADDDIAAATAKASADKASASGSKTTVDARAVTINFSYGSKDSPVASRDMFVRQSSMLNNIHL